MNALIPKNSEQVIGELSGWDRIVLSGTLRLLCCVDGMLGYLSQAGVLLKDFGEHAQAMTKCLIEASLEEAEKRHESGFPWIADFARAQTMMDGMHKINWPKVLDAVGRRLNPAHCRMFHPLEVTVPFIHGLIRIGHSWERSAMAALP